MKKQLTIILLATLFLKAEDSFLKGFYLGVDVTANAQGNESFGSSTMSDPSIDYKVDRGIQYSLGYKFNHIVKAEYTYSKFYSKEYNDEYMHSLAAVLSVSKYVGTRFLLDTSYNIYPSIEIGFTHDTFNAGASMNLDYNKDFEFLLSYRTLHQGLGYGGGSNNVDGYYLGTRYKF